MKTIKRKRTIKMDIVRHILQGEVELARHLIKTFPIDINQHFYIPLHSDTEMNDTEMNNTEMNDTEMNDEYLLELACSLGHLEMVVMLIEEGADPSIKQNSCIRIASRKGFTRIVTVLVSDKRVDPSVLNNTVIRNAVRVKDIESVRLLLTDERVDPCDNHNFVLREACHTGQEHMMSLLLSDKRIHPTHLNLINAYKLGHTQIVKLLLYRVLASHDIIQLAIQKKDYYFLWYLSRVYFGLYKKSIHSALIDMPDFFVKLNELEFQHYSILYSLSLPKDILKQVVNWFL